MTGQVSVSLRTRLRSGDPFLALFCIIPAVEVIEVAALAGFDGVILDTEHGSFGTETLSSLILAARARNIYPIVRVRRNEPSLIGAALDVGAAGVLVPQIGSEQEAVDAVRAARFAPQGSRGANPWVRAGGFGFTDDWFETANDDAAVLLMVEGAGGLKALAGILRIPDLDGIFIGPVDLSHALGVPGQTDHPAVRKAAIATIADAVDAGLTAGIFAPTVSAANAWIDGGATLVSVGVDSAHLGRTLASAVQQIRSRSAA